MTMPPESSTPVPSPCISLCEMDKATGLCRGCRAYDACGLPTALSMKAALRPGAQP